MNLNLLKINRENTESFVANSNIENITRDLKYKENEIIYEIRRRYNDVRLISDNLTLYQVLEYNSENRVKIDVNRIISFQNIDKQCSHFIEHYLHNLIEKRNKILEINIENLRSKNKRFYDVTLARLVSVYDIKVFLNDDSVKEIKSYNELVEIKIENVKYFKIKKATS